jgi:hypothetical protein
MDSRVNIQVSDIDEYVVELSGEIVISSDEVANATEATNKALNEVRNGRVTPDVNVVDVTGVSNELVSNFIVEFGDGGDSSIDEDNEWVVNEDEIIGWVPPEETELCGVSIGEYKSTASIQRGEKKINHEDEIRENTQEVIYRLADQNGEVVKFIDGKYVNMITSLFDIGVESVINRSFVTDENSLTLVKAPAPGWIVIAPLDRVCESAYLWETIVFNGAKTRTG